MAAAAQGEGAGVCRPRGGGGDGGELNPPSSRSSPEASYKLRQQFALTPPSSTAGLRKGQPMGLKRALSVSRYAAARHCGAHIPSHQAEERVDVAAIKQRGRTYSFRQLLLRHLFNEADGNLGLHPQYVVPCRALSSPCARRESRPRLTNPLYHSGAVPASHPRR